jgi:hypothetical protein
MAAFGQIEPSAGNQKRAPHPLPPTISDALYCMEGVQPSSTKSAYHIKYIYGVVDPRVDKPNELHLISYDENMKYAWMYEFLVEPNIDSGATLTWINTARLRQKDGHWTVKDTLGGVYSYQRVQDLAQRISKQEERLVSMPTTRPQGLVCKSH